MKKENYTVLVALFALSVLCPVKGMAQNIPPIADAGLSRYAAQDPVVLDGTGSFDPDNSGPLSYAWRQTSGPSVVITDANTPTPTISGFVQTDEIQECEFELVVSDGELTSLPDTAKVIVVPAFGDKLPELKNDSFDPDKPTFIFFGGSGDCLTGRTGSARNFFDRDGWLPRVNAIEFPKGYDPDSALGSHTYYRCGDMIIVYLSAVAPNYNQPIQISGHSAGGMPAIDVGIHLNLTYADPRYAVNRVTFFDVACRLLSVSLMSLCVEQFIASAVDGEQCWVDNYPSTWLNFPTNALNVAFPGGSHGTTREWYNYSLTTDDMNKFNNGVIAGAYWSVVGPGKNLQLASTLDMETYRFRWYGGESSGYMDFYDEPNHPGRLPEPVTLVGPADGAVVDANGALLSCEESENAVGYQLLFGPDPHSLVYLFSDTPSPPTEIIMTFPFKETWWTVKVRDQYGSTIYADPVCIYAEDVKAQTIENVSIWKTYSSIQNAINNAHPGDEIVVSPGICQYIENIDFQGKNLTVRSTDPNAPAIVAATIINGGDKGSAVTFSSGEDANCVLVGFTITNANIGIYCSGASPTIANCCIVANKSAGIELREGSNPTIANCCICDNAGVGIEMWVHWIGRLIIYNYPTITNCTIAGNLQHGILGGIPTIANSIIWANSHQQISDTQGSATYSNIQGGWAGESNIDVEPYFVDPSNGDYHLKSQAGRWDPISQSWITDDVTSPCVDAGDPGTPVGLEPLPNGDIINMGAYGGTAEASKSPGN